MNAKAEELGMQNTHFINASGAYKSGQFSTARDMAILSCYAMKNEMFRTIVSTPYYTVPPNQVRKKELKMINGNDLIVPSEKNRQYYPEAVGVKTGSTENGGKCLVSAATRNGNTVIAVMLGAKEGGSKLQRMNRVFRDSAKVLDKALSEEYSPVPLSSLPVEWDLVSEQNGVKYIQHADPAASGISLPNSVIDHLLQDPSAVKVLSNPGRLDNISVGEKSGTLQIFWDDILLYDSSYTLQEIEVPPTPEPVLSSSPLPSNTSEPVAETPSPMSATRKMSGLLARIPSGMIWGGAAVLAASGGVLVYSLIRKNSK
jgi:D-alanyl-D-alanine carboxypeptidase